MTHQREASHTEWFGFSCPHCHTLFRVRVENRGRRVECPGCGEVVRIPAPGRPVPRGMEPGEVPFSQAPPERKGEEFPEPGLSEKVEEEGRRVRRKVVKTAGQPEEFGWEAEEDGGGAAQVTSRDSLLPIVVGGLAVLILMAGVVTFIFLNQNRLERQGTKLETGKIFEIPGDAGSSESEMAILDVELSVELPIIRQTVRDFLAAETVDEVLARSRGGEDFHDVIREYHSRQPLAPVVARKIAPTGRVQRSQGLWAVDVRLPDFSLKPLALERVKGRYLVDWASWVGYSEVPWERVQEVRPTEPVLFRVICRPVPYYNFGFSDDRKWRAYRLLSPDQKHTLFGYVERNSIREGMLPKIGGRDLGDAFLLRLRFTDQSGPDQVLIEEVVSSGWVMRELDKSAPGER